MKRTAAVLTVLLLAACSELSPTPSTTGNTAPTVTLKASPMTGTAPYNSVLTATATDPEGDALTYMWTTDSGTVPGSSSFSYTMSQAGSYPVSVSVSDGASSVSQSVTLSANAAPVVPGNHAPVVSLSVSAKQGTAPFKVTFSAQGGDVDGDPLSYVWSFGDGSSASSDKGMTHTYEKAGSYTATVTVSDGRGGTDSAAQKVTVSEKTRPDPVKGDGTVKLNVTPKNASWTVGSESGSGDGSVKLAPGTYTLSVTPADGSPFSPSTQSVTVKTDKTVAADVKLEPIRSASFDVLIRGPGRTLARSEKFYVEVYAGNEHFNFDDIDLPLTFETDAGPVTLVYESGYQELPIKEVGYTWQLTYHADFPESMVGQSVVLRPRTSSPFQYDFTLDNYYAEGEDFPVLLTE